MTKKVINKAQEYLTVIQNDGDKVYQIVNIELLLRRHPPHAVIAFLKELRNDCSKQLKKLLKENVSDVRINEVVARKFRIKMAITTIRNYDKEVKEVA
jgi:hypothetical protein